jgi:hypothetical protein
MYVLHSVCEIMPKINNYLVLKCHAFLICPEMVPCPLTFKSDLFITDSNVYFFSHQSTVTISLRQEVWAHQTNLTLPLFYWSARNKPGKWAVMYLCISINFAFLRFWCLILELFQQCGMLFLNFNLYLSVMFDSYSCSYTSIPCLAN